MSNQKITATSDGSSARRVGICWFIYKNVFTERDNEVTMLVTRGCQHCVMACELTFFLAPDIRRAFSPEALSAGTVPVPTMHSTVESVLSRPGVLEKGKLNVFMSLYVNNFYL